MINPFTTRGHVGRPVRGARAGLEATAMMTAVFAIFDAAGWVGQLPPRQVAKRLLPHGSESATWAATITSHAGYGTLLGAGYSLLPVRRSALIGALFGVLVGAVSYEALLPALKIRPPLHRDSWREIAALTAAHVVYGVGLQQRLAKLTTTAVAVLGYDQDRPSGEASNGHR